MGLGGFVDGIVLHQIAQWHNMLSSTERWPASTVEGMERNILADGLFQAATWILVALGIWLLWNVRRSGGYASGWVLIGWMLAGGFSTWSKGPSTISSSVSITVRHESLAWDLGFLGLLVVGGWLLARSAGQPRRSSLSAMR